MNKNIIELTNNQYAISDDFGNIRIVSIQSSDNNQDIKEIFKTENDIEQLEQALDENRKNLKDIKSKTIWGEFLNVLTYAGLIMLYMLNPLSTIGQLIVIVYAYILLKGFNCLQNGTRIGRFIKKRKTRKNIEIIEQLLIDMRNSLEKIKRNTKYKELTEKSKEIDKKQDYSYKFNPYEEQITYQDKKNEIQVLKLKRKPIKELINNKIDN